MAGIKNTLKRLICFLENEKDIKQITHIKWWTSFDCLKISMISYVVGCLFILLSELNISVSFTYLLYIISIIAFLFAFITLCISSVHSLLSVYSLFIILIFAICTGDEILFFILLLLIIISVFIFHVSKKYEDKVSILSEFVENKLTRLFPMFAQNFDEFNYEYTTELTDELIEKLVKSGGDKYYLKELQKSGKRYCLKSKNFKSPTIVVGNNKYSDIMSHLQSNIYDGNIFNNTGEFTDDLIDKLVIKGEERSYLENLQNEGFRLCLEPNSFIGPTVFDEKYSGKDFKVDKFLIVPPKKVRNKSLPKIRGYNKFK